MVKLLFLIFVLFFSTKSISSQIKIALPLIPNWSSLDQSGFMDELLKLLKKNGLKNFETTQYPVKRAIQNFILNRNDCIAGGDKAFASRYSKEIILSSNPIFKTDVSLYLPIGHKNKISSLDQLKNKPVGILRGFSGSFSHLVKNKGLKILKGNSIDQLILMLNSNRIQAIIYNGTSLSLENRKFVDYNGRITLMSYLNTILCKENKVNSSFIKNFNIIYSKVLKSKEYYDLYFEKYKMSSPFIEK